MPLPSAPASPPPLPPATASPHLSHRPLPRPNTFPADPCLEPNTLPVGRAASPAGQHLSRLPPPRLPCRPAPLPSAPTSPAPWASSPVAPASRGPCIGSPDPRRPSAPASSVAAQATGRCLACPTRHRLELGQMRALSPIGCSTSSGSMAREAAYGRCSAAGGQRP
uniref:Predicted protein n=1 Tax=Hordeum vulgare subsp. vulgare TaxID=112509 RepID=F2CZB5_HORVV|nr:predicted protein [Hordeum vulgare subsp. vulgare]